MLERTIALALFAAAACLPASAANTAYDRAAGMATGETALGRGYDGANAAGAVKAPVSAAADNGGFSAPDATQAPSSRSVMNAASVPTPDAGFQSRRTVLEAVETGTGSVDAKAAGAPIGAVCGTMLGFGIALMLSKMLG